MLGRFEIDEERPDPRREMLLEEMALPWIGSFFVDLETAEHAEFYRPVATLGRLFIGIETKAFALPL